MDTASKSIFRFMLRTLMVVSIGLAIPIVWYVLADPFQVLRHYDTYFPDPYEYPVRIGMNKGLATMSNFVDRQKEGKHYDSFIFGSSISCYYDADDWASMLEDSMGDSISIGHECVRPYHFDSASETLMSMSRKIRFLDREGNPIRHALIVLDPIIMSADASDGPAYLDPPQLHESFLETAKYHYTFFRAATNADFFKSYIPSILNGKPIENGHNLLFERQPIVYYPTTNQEAIPMWDSLIRKVPDYFYHEYPLKKSPKDFTVRQRLLTGERLSVLEIIAGVFSRHATDYQIIIGPNRSKVVICDSDLLTLKRVFSPERVHDFGRTHAYLLENDTMLYDNTHYRPPMAEILMHEVYGN